MTDFFSEFVPLNFSGSPSTPSGIYKFYTPKITKDPHTIPNRILKHVDSRVDSVKFVPTFCLGASCEIPRSSCNALPKCGQCDSTCDSMHVSFHLSILFSSKHWDELFQKGLRISWLSVNTKSSRFPALPSMQPQPGGVKRSQHET